MKRHSAAILWLIISALLPPFLSYGQTEYQKRVTGLGHSQGETILDNGQLRFGGYSNSGQQEAIVRYTVKMDHPQNSSIECYATVYYVYDLNNNLIFQWCYLNDFPHPTTSDYTDLNSNNLSDCQAILANSTFIANADTFTGRDYDLMAYQADLDVNLSNERLFGSTWMEQMQFGAEAAVHWSMAPVPNGDYFVGATAQQIFGRASDVAIARINSSHQVIWNARLDKENHERFYQSTYLNSNTELLVHGPKGYQPSRLYWLNSSNGNLLRSLEYDVEFSTRRYTPYWGHALEDASTLTDVHFIGHTVYRPKGDSLECRMVYLRSSNQGVRQTQKVYVLEDEHIFPARITEINSNAYLVTGRLREQDLSDSDGFVMKIDRSGAVQWARRVDFASYEDTRDAYVDANGDIWVLGRTNAYESNPEIRNYAIYHFNSSGTFLDAHYYLKPLRDVARSLLVTATGDMILDGYQPSGWKRYYVRTQSDGTGPLCSTVPFEANITSLTFSLPEVTGYTETINDVTVTNAVFLEQDFDPGVEDVTCPDCDCDQ